MSWEKKDAVENKEKFFYKNRGNVWKLKYFDNNKGNLCENLCENSTMPKWKANIQTAHYHFIMPKYDQNITCSVHSNQNHLILHNYEALKGDLLHAWAHLEWKQMAGWISNICKLFLLSGI